MLAAQAQAAGTRTNAISPLRFSTGAGDNNKHDKLLLISLKKTEEIHHITSTIENVIPLNLHKEWDEANLIHILFGSIYQTRA
jgi:hypothetical protein